MSDPVLDSLVLILSAMDPPPPMVQIGEPETVDLDGMIAIWYSGDSGDLAVVKSLGTFGSIEQFTVAVYWMLEAGATPDALAEHEYTVRATIRRIKATLHAHLELSGYPGQGQVSGSYLGATTIGAVRDDGGGRFLQARIPYIFENLDADPVGL
jgi:hypothetical protein